jgi:hypothetical protein
MLQEKLRTGKIAHAEFCSLLSKDEVAAALNEELRFADALGQGPTPVNRFPAEDAVAISNKHRLSATSAASDGLLGWYNDASEVP